MKIFAISDTHGNLDGLDPSGYDVVVMSGDLAPLRGWNSWGQTPWRNCFFMPFLFVLMTYCSFLRVCPQRVHRRCDIIVWNGNDHQRLYLHGAVCDCGVRYGRCARCSCVEWAALQRWGLVKSQEPMDVPPT